MNRKQNAFTLVELLVVISIIALLISIILPALGEAKEIVRSATCLNNLKQVQLGAEIFANNHNNKYPSRYVVDPESGTGHTSVYLWYGDRGDGTSSGLSFADFEADDRPINEELELSADGLSISRCPTDVDVVAKATGTSYPVNQVLSNSQSGYGTNRDAIRSPSNFVVSSEAGAYYSIYAADPPNDSFVDGAFELKDLFWHRSSRTWNASFSDGHASSIFVKDYNVLTQNDFTFELDG